jgi:dihydrodipicolinate synthase/N-acetylneuraminate lyase
MGSGNGRTAWSWGEALCGVVPPLISPLDGAGAPDADAMAALVEHVLGAGCTGLFVLGGCGEGAWLTPSQRGAVVKGVARAAAGRAPVLAGVMLPATGPAVESARQAADLGADAVVVGSPYYFGVDGAAQQRHIEAVLKAVALPALLYNIPQCTHNVLAPDVVETLSADPRVLGIKDSAGDFEAFQRFLAIKRRRPDFRVLQGNEALLAASLLQGGDGLVPGLGNVVPTLMVALCRAAARGDAAECARLQDEVAGLYALYADGHWLPCLKAACATLGIGDGRPAPPLLPLGDVPRERIAAIVRRHCPATAR